MSACPGTHTCVWRLPERAASSASCWRRGGVAEVSTFILTCAPSCCSLRELRLAIWECEVLGRVSPCRVGWRSLAVVYRPSRVRSCGCATCEIGRYGSHTQYTFLMDISRRGVPYHKSEKLRVGRVRRSQNSRDPTCAPSHVHLVLDLPCMCTTSQGEQAIACLCASAAGSP